MLVIQASKAAVIVVDPYDEHNPTPTKALLDRELSQWVRDTDLDGKKKLDGSILWRVSEFGLEPSSLFA